MDPSLLKKTIRTTALNEGFDLVAFSNAVRSPIAAGHLDAFLRNRYHGDMTWMADTAERRKHPVHLWPRVSTVIVLGINYGSDTDPLATLSSPTSGSISVYARNHDYHHVVKTKLKRLARQVADLTQDEVKVFVDTAPVMEKPLAVSAGLGWQGKHTNLVSRRFGSWLFLGSIFTAATLEPDPPETDHCGSCRACLDVCPTGAFPAPHQIDARRCISYLTIEYTGHIPRDMRPRIGNRIYGCDDCLAVCPWNKFASRAREARLTARADLISPPLKELVRFDDTQFRRFFSRSPIKRTGRDRWIRNVLIAIGNSRTPTLAPSVHPLLTDHSPLVRAMAIWALTQLLPRERLLSARDRYAPRETDPLVRREWED